MTKGVIPVGGVIAGSLGSAGNFLVKRRQVKVPDRSQACLLRFLGLDKHVLTVVVFCIMPKGVYPRSEEERERLRALARALASRPKTAETRKKMSKASKTRWQNPVYREQQSARLRALARQQVFRWDYPRIVQMRQQGQTLQQIGNVFRVTRERIRQILMRGLTGLL